jgi:hypothetical protein
MVIFYILAIKKDGENPERHYFGQVFISQNRTIKQSCERSKILREPGEPGEPGGPGENHRTSSVLRVYGDLRNLEANERN